MNQTPLYLNTLKCNIALEEYKNTHSLDRMDQIAVKVLQTSSSEVANLPELNEVDKPGNHKAHEAAYADLAKRILKIKDALNIVNENPLENELDLS